MWLVPQEEGNASTLALRGTPFHLNIPDMWEQEAITPFLKMRKRSPKAGYWTVHSQFSKTSLCLSKVIPNPIFNSVRTQGDQQSTFFHNSSYSLTDDRKTVHEHKQLKITQPH